MGTDPGSGWSHHATILTVAEGTDGAQGLGCIIEQLRDQVTPVGHAADNPGWNHDPCHTRTGYRHREPHQRRESGAVHTEIGCAWIAWKAPGPNRRGPLSLALG